MSETPNYPVDFEDCTMQGGHCFKRTGMVLTSNPPQYPQVCKHCGATRTGMEQETMRYTEPVPRSYRRSQVVEDGANGLDV